MIFGATSLVNTTAMTKDWGKVKGQYVGREIYNSDDTDGETSYRLIYTYDIDGQTYVISTNYGTNSIPQLGASKTIRYNPENPEQAAFADFSSDVGLMIFGFIFALLPSLMVLAVMGKMNAGAGQIVMGFVFAAMGGGAYYLMGMNLTSFSPKAVYEGTGIAAILVIIFMTFGILIAMGGMKGCLRKWKEGSSQDPYHK